MRSQSLHSHIMVEGGMQEWKGCATKCFAFCHYKSESRFKMPLNPGIPTSDSGEEKIR